MNQTKVNELLEVLSNSLNDSLHLFTLEVERCSKSLTVTAVSDINSNIKFLVLSALDMGGITVNFNVRGFSKEAVSKIHQIISDILTGKFRDITDEDKLFLNEAIHASRRSKAKRAKVGAVLLPGYAGYKIIRSYNSMHPNYPQECEYTKDGKLISHKEVFHAELRVIGEAAKLGVPTKDATLYVTTSPCINCALAIVAAGIKEVLYIDEYRDTSGLSLLQKCGVETYQVSVEQLK